VKFKAILTGDPNPEVIWYINGIPLTPSEKVSNKFLKIFTSLSLRFNSLAKMAFVY